MATHKEKLDGLEQQERRQLVRGVVAGVGLLAVFVGIFFLLAVPASSKEVTGTIVSFGTEASDSAIHRYVIVKLDQGLTVNARVHGGAPIRIGRRALLDESTMKVLGWKRYRFKQILDEGAQDRTFTEINK